jgi:hypothetical protein
MPAKLGLWLAFGTAAALAAVPVTFNKDVLPVLQKNCQSCHRPGQAGPMSFLTFESTRPWAKAIKEAAASRKMPPWFADPGAGHLLNARSLKQSDIDLLARWADTGAAQGDPKDAPAPIEWPEGWVIKPDVIVEGPTYDVPAHPKNNVIEWISVAIPSGFTEDTWITSVEIKPQHPEVTHHMCVSFTPHRADAKYFAPIWRDKSRDADGSALPDKGPTFTGGFSLAAVEDCYLPGSPALDFRPLDAEIVYMAPHMHARGKDMTFTLEYPNGRQEILLNVRHYDFNWQFGYQTSAKVPKGSTLRVDAHFDNSPNNKFNPDPNRTVYYGEMTWER